MIVPQRDVSTGEVQLTSGSPTNGSTYRLIHHMITAYKYLIINCASCQRQELIRNNLI